MARPGGVDEPRDATIANVAKTLPVCLRYYLCIPCSRAGARSPSPFVVEIIDAAQRLLREWTGQCRLMGFDKSSGALWDLSGRKPAAVDRFEGRSVHVLCNVGFLMLDEPPLGPLRDGALEHGACWTGSGSHDLLAFAFLCATGDAVDRAAALPLAALRAVTARVDDDSDDDDAALRNSVASHPRIAVAHGAERSPAMAGFAHARSRRTALSPTYWNTAIAEPGGADAHALPVAGDAGRMRAALIDALATSRVPFVANALLNELETRTGERVPASHPVEVHLSMTGRCNIECRFCGYTYAASRSDFVSLEQIQRLDFLDRVGTLRLNSGLGEPTLNRNLGQIIAYVARRHPHIAMNFFTNAVPLGRPGLIDAIVGNVRWINVSLNAASRDEWKVQCKADHFDRVCDNVAELTRVKRETGSLWPILHASMVLNRSNFHELPLMPALCRRLGIDRLTAFPYFALGFGSDKFGPDTTLAAFRDEYDALYEATLEQARIHEVSIEIPLPTESHCATFGLEKRLLNDFAEIESNDWPLGRLLSGIAFDRPPGSHCHFLWRQGAIGSTNHAGQSADATHYMYPCLGPLSSVDLSRRTAFTFEPDFMGLWRNPVFTHLREAQHTAGVCEVCDRCRGSDTRDPAGFETLERLVGRFAARHGHVASIAPIVIDTTALTRAGAGSRHVVERVVR